MVIGPLPATVAATVLGAGTSLLVAAVLPAVGPDPRQIRDAPSEHADVTAQSFVALGLHVTLLAAAVAPMLLLPDLLPVTIPAALAGALDCSYLLLRLSAARLTRAAPDVLQHMRSRRTTAISDRNRAGAAVPWPVWVIALAALILLVPQSLVPAAMKITGEVEPVWFIALHLPPAWQWPAIITLGLLGVGLGTCAAWWWRSIRRG